MKLEDAIKRIEEVSKFTLNENQKEIAKKILRSAPKEELSEYFNFVMQRIKLGFTFDIAPEIANGKISIIKENLKLGINVNENVDGNENKLIIGENYDALKNLLLTHSNKINLIYIDPPYNTERAREEGNSHNNYSNQKFSYFDKFSKSGWLNMMNMRLKLAKKLLSENGIIFVSIDDTEQAYLKVLMDEIFGEECFVKTLIYQTNTNIMKNSKNFRKDHEYIHVYAKGGIFVNFKREENKKLIFQNCDNDVNGPWISTNATYKLNNKVKNYFSLKHPTKDIYFLRTWRFSKEDYSQKKINLYFKDKNVPRIKEYKKKYNLNNKIPSTILNFNDFNLPFSNEGMDSFTQAKKELFSILSNEEFETPKPIKLIKWLIKRINKKNITVLDFFAGSGSTGHAILQLNKEDKGNRKFILVTNNENKIGENICYERIYRIIKGEGTDGDKNFSWIKKNKSFFDCKLRVFYLKTKDISLGLNIDNLKSETTEEFKKLNPDFKFDKEIQIYYKLSSLRQLKRKKNN